MRTYKYSEVFHKRALLQLMLLGVLLYVVAVGFSGLGASLAAIRSTDIEYLSVSIGLIGLSYVFSAITYCLLASRKITFMATFLVQISTGLVNRLLPAGLGGLGINAFYLKKCGHSLSTALTIVATNNALGVTGNVVLLVVAAAFIPLDLSHLTLPDVPVPLVVTVVSILFVAGLYLRRHHRLAHKVGRSLHEIRTYFMVMSGRPLRSLCALLSSMMLTGLHAAGLYSVLMALDMSVQVPLALIAVSVGAFTGAALPTPGGLGGAEAGIAAVLVVFAVPASSAVAAALIYRGVTYWLPLLPGYLALRLVEKRYLY